MAIPQIAGAARTQNLVFQSFGRRVQVQARRAGEMVGKEEEELRLRTVDFQFDYVAKGEKHKGTIVADECIYTPTVQKAVFQGHVKLTTDDGAELRTEQLIYRGDKQLATQRAARRVQAPDAVRARQGLRVPRRGAGGST